MPKREWCTGENYDKATWMRREQALPLELAEGYARFLGHSPPDGNYFDEMKKLIAELNIDQNKIQEESEP